MNETSLEKSVSTRSSPQNMTAPFVLVPIRPWPSPTTALTEIAFGIHLVKRRNEQKQHDGGHRGPSLLPRHFDIHDLVDIFVFMHGRYCEVIDHFRAKGTESIKQKLFYCLSSVLHPPSVQSSRSTNRRARISSTSVPKRSRVHFTVLIHLIKRRHQ